MRFISNEELQAVGGGYNEVTEITVVGYRDSGSSGWFSTYYGNYTASQGNQMAATLGVGAGIVGAGAAVLAVVASPLVVPAIVVSGVVAGGMALGGAGLAFAEAFRAPGA